MSRRLANGHGSSKTPGTLKAASVKLSSSDDHSSSENVEHDDVAGSDGESAPDDSSLPNTSNGSAIIKPDSSKLDASDPDTEEEEDSGEGEEENDDVSSGDEDINADSSKLDASDPDTEEEEDSDDGEEENDDGSSGDEENSENAETDSGSSSAADEKHKADSKGKVLVPSFQLPFSIEQDESSRYELWTIRVPCSLASDPTQLAELLQGQTVSIANSASSSSASASQPFPKLASPSTGNSAKYPPDRSSRCQLEWGNSTENESFRMILPANANSTSTVLQPNVPRAESMLHPLPVPFKRHLNLVELASLIPHHELAPPVELQPPPIVTNMSMSTNKGTASREVAQRQKYAQIGTTIESRQVRRAYSQVPQRGGLKRRWQPIGGSAKSMAAARGGNRKRSRSLSEASVSVSAIQHLQQPQQSMRAAAAGTQVKLEPTVSTAAAVKSSYGDEESDRENGETVKSKKEKKRLKKEMKKLKKAIKDEK
jgi:hypothetical protein